MSDRSREKRTERRITERENHRRELLAFGQRLDAELLAAGLSEADLVLRRVRALAYMHEVTETGEERDQGWILNNMARIIRGQEPLERRAAPAPRPNGPRDPRRR